MRVGASRSMGLPHNRYHNANLIPKRDVQSCGLGASLQAVDEYIMDSNPPSQTILLARSRFFSSLPETMLSLYMSILGGVSWEEMVVPLGSMSPVWLLLFLFYISFAYLAVLNVITGAPWPFEKHTLSPFCFGFLLLPSCFFSNPGLKSTLSPQKDHDVVQLRSSANRPLELNHPPSTHHNVLR